MKFSKQEYWSGLPFPSPGDCPDPEIEYGFPALQANSLPSEPLSFIHCTIINLSSPSSILFSSVQFSSVQFSHSVVSGSLQPMDCSTPDFPVHHRLLELAQTHVHRVGDAIQPSHPLLSPSPPAFNLSQLV